MPLFPAGPEWRRDPVVLAIYSQVLGDRIWQAGVTVSRKKIAFAFYCLNIRSGLNLKGFLSCDISGS